MTRSEFFEKYGSTILNFSYYYKFRFHYTGRTVDGSYIEVVSGGDSDNIYRSEFSPQETISSLDPHTDYINDELIFGE